jgi:hypothetical protein
MLRRYSETLLRARGSEYRFPDVPTPPDDAAGRVQIRKALRIPYRATRRLDRATAFSLFPSPDHTLNSRAESVSQTSTAAREKGDDRKAVAA